MHGRGRVAALAALAATAVSTVAAANPSVDLGRARKEYDQGRYTDAVGTLYRLLYTDKVPLPLDEALEAHRLLAISYFFLDQKNKADDEFLEVLRIDPDYELNRQIEDPGVVDAFLNVRAVHQDELRQIRRDRALAEARKELKTKEVVISREVRDPQAWKNWMPFGVGQFKNGDDGMGFLFAGSEVLLASTSLFVFFYEVQTYGFGFPSKIDNEDVATVNLLEGLRYGTGAAFLIAYGLGVWHARAHTRPRIVETRTERLVPNDSSKDQPQSYMPTLVPIITPSGVALAAQWEF